MNGFENGIVCQIRTSLRIPAWRKIEYPRASKRGRLWQWVLARAGLVHVLRDESPLALLWHAQRKYALIYDALQMRRHYRGCRIDNLKISMIYQQASAYEICGLSVATAGKEPLGRAEWRLLLNNGELTLEECLTTYAASPCILTMPHLSSSDIPV